MIIAIAGQQVKGAAPSKPRRRKAQKRQRAMAARQALRLCEAEMLGRSSSSRSARLVTLDEITQSVRPSPATSKAALRAAGLPPHLAVEMRRRLHLITAPGTER
jgi:hypothetical protein